MSVSASVCMCGCVWRDEDGGQIQTHVSSKHKLYLLHRYIKIGTKHKPQNVKIITVIIIIVIQI